MPLCVSMQVVRVGIQLGQHFGYVLQKPCHQPKICSKRAGLLPYDVLQHHHVASTMYEAMWLV